MGNCMWPSVGPERSFTIGKETVDCCRDESLIALLFQYAVPLVEKCTTEFEKIFFGLDLFGDVSIGQDGAGNIVIKTRRIP